jgi:hypothetical protein
MQSLDVVRSGAHLRAVNCARPPHLANLRATLYRSLGRSVIRRDSQVHTSHNSCALETPDGRGCERATRRPTVGFVRPANMDREGAIVDAVFDVLRFLIHARPTIWSRARLEASELANPDASAARYSYNFRVLATAVWGSTASWPTGLPSLGKIRHPGAVS